jgi:hypothetical protein
MPRTRSLKLPEYAASDEAAAYIADMLMEIALQFESPTSPKSAVITSPSSQNLMIIPASSSIYSTNTRSTETRLSKRRTGDLIWSRYGVQLHEELPRAAMLGASSDEPDDRSF